MRAYQQLKKPVFTARKARDDVLNIDGARQSDDFSLNDFNQVLGIFIYKSIN